MPSEIPFPDASFWDQQINLSNVPFRIVGYWNEVAQFWSISVYTINNDVIVEGAPVMINSRVSQQWEYIARKYNPAFGAIFCLTTNYSSDNLTRYSFGDNALLAYYTQEDLNA